MLLLPLLGLFIGGAIQAYGAKKAGDAQGAAADASAEQSWDEATLADRNAALILDRASDDERKYRVMARRQLGSIKVAMASSGLLGGEDILEEAAATFEEDALNIRKGARGEASAYRHSAEAKRKYAGQLRRGGADARTGGALAAAGKILGTVGNIAEKLPSGN